jgi:plasmid stability protein
VADILIRDLPDDVVEAIDARARAAGLSRSEYLRRLLARDGSAAGAVTVDDLGAFATRFADLADSELIERAWR